MASLEELFCKLYEERNVLLEENKRLTKALLTAEAIGVAWSLRADTLGDQVATLEYGIKAAEERAEEAERALEASRPPAPSQLCPPMEWWW
jgi:hypothetical protein